LAVHQFSWLLTIILTLPLVAMAIIALVDQKFARPIAIAVASAILALSLWVWSQFNVNAPGFQFQQQGTWISAPLPLQYHVGIDGFSLCLVLLTTFVTWTAVLASDTVTTRPKLYYAMVMLLTTAILGVFMSLDLLQFFIFYELELIPMYFLIAIWGGPRRDYAAMKFLIYTFLGGVFMLGSLLYVYMQVCIENPGSTFNMIDLAAKCPGLPKFIQGLGFLGFFIAFIIKLPSFPFHTWLPDAHVEAPTPISMILAALLLKMGSYGLVRICMGFFPNVFADYGHWIMLLGAFNIVWAAIACLVQQDMKRIIALSSVSHMGFILLAIGSLSACALNGAIFQMISHGVVSAALFFLVGTIYERCHTRQLNEIGGGLARQMPIVFYFWMLAALANLGLPGLSGFVGETGVFYGAYSSPMSNSPAHGSVAQAAVLFATIGTILTAGYMLWLLKRLFYGEELPKWAGHLFDAKPNEQFVAWCLSLAIVGLGIYPLVLIDQFNLISTKITSITTSRLKISMH
jgi:proton-translocating NADH-quinone oxidoreductase chain M